MRKHIFNTLRALVVIVMLPQFADASVVFQTNFDTVPAWNPGAYDACWENTQVEGGGSSCTQHPWSGSWSSDSTLWNDYRVMTPQCQNIYASHIGGAADILSATGKTFSPYGGAGKSYVHVYEPCMSGSGGFGADGLLGVYFGKTTGYPELYIQWKVRFDSSFSTQWVAGALQKLMHVTHFDETVTQGVLQAFHFFYPDNMPTIDPGVGWNSAYSSVPGFYEVAYNANNTQTGGIIVYNTGINIFDGNWHTFQYHVKLNTAAGVADGIGELWLDSETTGTPVLTITNIPFTGASSPSASAFGFNRVMIGGNTSNTWLSGGQSGSNPSCTTEKTCPTQLYTLDDLVISTTPIPSSHVVTNDIAPIPNGGSSDTTPPAAPGAVKVR